MNLFDLQIPLDHAHPNFRRTISDGCEGVRDALTAWAEGFKDRDGKFIKEFQLTYNSGFWELYLFAVLKHLGLNPNLEFHAPDFVCDEQNFVIEAATANHAFDDVPEWEKTIAGVTEADLELGYKQSIIRFSNTIDYKIKRYRERYAQLKQCQERPFILAISNYATQDFTCSAM